MNEKQTKKMFIQKVEKDFREIVNRFQSLKDRIQQGDFDNEADLQSKYSKLDEKLNHLGWRIEKFKGDQISLDEDVKHSFNELFDELDWRFKALEAAMKDKEIWESRVVSKRGKKLIKTQKKSQDE